MDPKILDAFREPWVVTSSTGVILQTSTQISVLTGYTPEELGGQNITILMPNPHRKAHDGYMAKFLGGEKEGAMTNKGRKVPVLRKDGSTVPSFVTASSYEVGEETRFLGVLRDITEEHVTEKFWDLNLGLLCTAGGEPPRFQRLSPSWEKVLGRDLEELRSRPFVDFIHPDDVEKTNALIAEQLSAGSPALNFENRYRHKDGHWVWLSWTAVLEDGVFFASARDMSLYRDGQEKLQSALEELQQFSYIVSHDLQEPIRSILGHMSFLDEVSPLMDEDQRESWVFVQDAAKDLRKMVEGLLELSRVDTRRTTFRNTSIGAVVNKAVRNLDGSIRESGAHLVLSSSFPVLAVDEHQMVGVFQNLISNAIKFRKAGIPPEIQITSEEAEGGWKFCVVDHGVGFRPDQAERALQIFQRLHTQEEFKGTGLGLALAAKVVAMHRGRLRLTSAGVGAGCSACVWLPSRPDYEVLK
jgi:PAS domain S-box-containing protein